MREELGVNPITTPSIQEVLKTLEVFRPVPVALIDSANREATFNNRLQDSHALRVRLLRTASCSPRRAPAGSPGGWEGPDPPGPSARSGSVLTKRSKSLLEYSDKGDWMGIAPGTRAHAAGCRDVDARTPRRGDGPYDQSRRMAPRVPARGNSTADAYSPAKLRSPATPKSWTTFSTGSTPCTRG